MYTGAVMYAYQGENDWYVNNKFAAKTKEQLTIDIEAYIQKNMSQFARDSWNIRYSIADNVELYDVKLNVVVKERVNEDGTPYAALSPLGHAKVGAEI